MQLDKLQSVLEKQCLIKRDQPLLVAVSGGPDSLCLLDILWRLKYSLVVAHLDHGLRPESATDAQAVNRLAERMGLPFVLGNADVPALADRQGLSIEEAARIARYSFLFQQAGKYHAQAVATAHTADDQAETVLMHLLRGAGLAGLSGMDYRSLPNAWSPSIPLVRPLLGAWREEILAYLQERDLQPIIDQSNLDTRFYRNRLRHELLPYLESYNPGIRLRLWRTADTLRQDLMLLEKIIGDAWESCMPVEGKGYISFITQAVQSQPLGIQRHLARRAVYALRPNLRDVTFETIERAVELFKNPSPLRQIDLLAGIRLLQEDDRLWLATWEADLPHPDWPQIDSGTELEMGVPGKVELPGGWILEASLLDNFSKVRERAQSNIDTYTAYLDMERLRLPLQVRSRRPGDRFQPLGMGGHSIKLSDYMINVKLPKRARPNWPLVCSGQEIGWVAGFRTSDLFRITDLTTRIAHLRLYK